MKAGSIAILSVFLCHLYAVIGVPDFQIFTAKISAVTVPETKVPVCNRIIFDAVAGGNIYLHTVICHKVVIAPAHDFVGGIVK